MKQARRSARIKLYQKKDFMTLRYPKGKIHEDEFTTYKVLFQYKEIAVINQPLYAYYQNPASITTTDWNPKKLAKIEALEERLSYIKKNHLEPYYGFTAGVLLGNILEHYYAKLDQIAYPAGSESSEKEGMI